MTGADLDTAIRQYTAYFVPHSKGLPVHVEIKATRGETGPTVIVTIDGLSFDGSVATVPTVSGEADVAEPVVDNGPIGHDTVTSTGSTPVTVAAATVYTPPPLVATPQITTVTPVETPEVAPVVVEPAAEPVVSRPVTSLFGNRNPRTPAEVRQWMNQEAEAEAAAENLGVVIEQVMPSDVPFDGATPIGFEGESKAETAEAAPAAPQVKSLFKGLRKPTNG